MEHTLKIVHDSDSNPRFDWDNLGTFAYKHSRYNLGEEEISDPIDWLAEKLNLSELQVSNIAKKLDADYYSNKVKNYLEDKFLHHSDYIGLPVYIYDHSGISLSTSPFGCRWDSGQVGYIYVSKEKVLSEFGGKIVSKKMRENILSYLEGEIETQDTCVRGDVYGFQVLDEDENIVDSCYGFFGDNFVKNGMIEHIDAELFGGEEKLREILENIKCVIG
jgi:DNA-binding Lrp family transcriptional regulator